MPTQRTIWPKLKKELENELVIVITGPRRAGKTTSLHWLLDQISSTNKYYFDLENIINRDLFETRNYEEILTQLERVGLDRSKRMYIAIDEIQFVPNLPSVVKYLSDHYQVKFILSGSSSYYLKNTFSESMAGRKKIFELLPLSFQELLRFKGEEFTLDQDIRRLTLFDAVTYHRLRVYYDEFLEFGGLPSVVLAKSPEEKRSRLEEIYSAYVNLDVQSLSDFKSLTEFRNLVRLIAARVGSKVNTSECASILGISRTLVESYLKFMEQTYLIRTVPVYSQSIDVKIRKQEKIYFIDNGILNLHADISSGAKFENLVAHQLAEYGALQYYEHQGKEIDFIVNGKVAVEVKETPTPPDLSVFHTRSQELTLDTTYLVGRLAHASFDQYVWGGQIG